MISKKSFSSSTIKTLAGIKLLQWDYIF